MFSQFALDLSRARKTSGYSQQEIADLALIDQPTLSKLENGERRPSVPLLSRFSLIFNRAFTSVFDDAANTDAPRMLKQVDRIMAGKKPRSTLHNRSFALTQLKRRLETLMQSDGA